MPTGAGLRLCVFVNGAGKVDATVSAAGAGVKVSTPIGTAKSGFNVVQFKDGKTTFDAVSGGTSGSFGVSNSKKVKVGDNATQSARASAGDDGGTVTVGVKLGVVGAEVSANLKKAGAAVADFFQGMVNYLENAVKELNTTSTNTNTPK